MENPEEILHSLEEFSKMKPKDIPRELEEYLCFVAKTGNPVYQWPTIKSLFREKLLNVITEFYESCPSVEIPPCPNVEMFNYDLMKNFILEKLDTFASAPFTVQRICELLTTPRKEYNRIDKYMRALEKNILVVSTTEPGRRSTENGESIMNGIESEHLPESSNSSHDINVEEMDESPSWPRTAQMAPILFETSNNENQSTEIQENPEPQRFQITPEIKVDEMSLNSTVTSTKLEEGSQQDTVISCSTMNEPQHPYVSIEPVTLSTCATSQEITDENATDNSLTITALPAGVQQRRNSMEKVQMSENGNVEESRGSISPENEKQGSPEEEESIQPLAESILSCSEPVEDLPGTNINKHLEEIVVIKEQSDIESISPESSSPSMETLQVDIGRDNYENQLESTEKLDEKNQDQTQIVQNEVSLKEDKWSEVEKKTVEITCESSLDENVDSIIKTSDSSEHVSDLSRQEEIMEPLKEAEAKLNSYEEDNSKNILDSKEAVVQEAEPESSNIDATCTMQTLMDVDIISEKINEKQEHSCEEPSSTSNAL